MGGNHGIHEFPKKLNTFDYAVERTSFWIAKKSVSEGGTVKAIESIPEVNFHADSMTLVISMHCLLHVEGDATTSNPDPELMRKEDFGNRAQIHLYGDRRCIAPTNEAFASSLFFQGCKARRKDVILS